eukprot:454986-Pyramimonas_sp.AAC.1
MAALHDKLGEGKQAESCRRAAKAPTAPKEAPESVQARLNKASWKMRGANKKLESALEKHEALERQLGEQKT